MPQHVKASFDPTLVLVLCAILVLTVLHFLGLPLLVTYDGHLYLDQALMLGEPRFWTDWHFLRTPILQLVTRLIFELVGVSSKSLIFINTIFGLIGIFCCYKIARFWASRRVATFSALVVALNPLLITYQHTYLTEAGSFAFVSLVTFLLLNAVESGFRVRQLIWLGTAITIGYYFRPTLFMLSPPALVCVFLFAPKRNWLRVRAQALAVIFILPFVATVPWRMLGSSQHWEDTQIIFGLVNQAVFPPDSPMLGSASEQYRASLERSLVNGSLTSTGIMDGEVYQFLGPLEPQARGHSEKWFMQVVSSYPWRYLSGVTRGALLFAGIPGQDSDNNVFLQRVMTSEKSIILPGPANTQTWVEEHLLETVGSGLFRDFLTSLVSPYVWLYRLGLLCLVIFVALSLFRIQPLLFALGAPTLWFLAYHALTLFSLDRMAVPVIPLVCTVPVVACAVLARILMSIHGKRGSKTRGRNVLEIATRVD